MTVTKIRLFDDARELILGGRDNTRRGEIYIHTLDAGSPAVRAVTEDRTGANGVYDTTTLYGGRTVAMTATIYSSELLHELASYLSPRLRPNLGVTDPAVFNGERFLALRRDNFTPGEINNLSHLRRQLQLQWACPTGVWQATEPVTFALNAQAEEISGRTYPLVFPRIYPAAAPIGTTIVDNPGTEPADQTVRMYGPCRAPRYTNDTTGETITFTTDLVLGLGDYVEVNTANHTAFLNSDPAASRAQFIDYALSTWWQIPPGTSSVHYHPLAEVDVGAGSVTTFRPAWLDS